MLLCVLRSWAATTTPDHGGRQGSELAGAAFRWSIALNSGLTASVQPHRQKTFKLSTDPFFVEKVRDIVGLYLNPPDKAMVLCVDEKTQIQCYPWVWVTWRG